MRAQVKDENDRERKRDREELQRIRHDYALILNTLGIHAGDYYVQEKAMRVAGVLAASQGEARALESQLERTVRVFQGHVDKLSEMLTSVRNPA